MNKEAQPVETAPLLCCVGTASVATRFGTADWISSLIVARCLLLAVVRLKALELQPQVGVRIERNPVTSDRACVYLSAGRRVSRRDSDHRSLGNAR
jgi:hypothetical protein